MANQFDAIQKIEWLLERQNPPGAADFLIRTFLADDPVCDSVLSVCANRDLADCDAIREALLQNLIAQDFSLSDSLGRKVSVNTLRAHCGKVARALVSYRRRTNGDGLRCKCDHEGA